MRFWRMAVWMTALAACWTATAQTKPSAATPATTTAKKPVVRPTARRAKAKAKKPAVAAPIPTPTPAPRVYPKPPVEQPANPPVVRMQNGLISVEAVNANLSDVLQQVRQLTGAAMEGLNYASGERIVASIAPAAPRQVVMALLDGSKLDYVLLSPSNNQQGLQKIVLFRRQAESNFGGSRYAPAPRRNEPAPVAEDNSGVDEEAADAAAEAASEDPNQNAQQQQMLEQIQRSHAQGQAPPPEAQAPPQ